MLGKITLPRTTSVSLNDRFSTLRQLRENQQQEERLHQHASSQASRHQQQEVRLRQHTSSQANRHLAEEMEQRPAVRAGLIHPQRVAPAAPASPPQKRLHVKQRLAIQARLGVLRTTPAGGALVGRLGRGRAPQAKRLQTAARARSLTGLPGGASSSSDYAPDSDVT
ncbi:chromatin target of PRMT1 protein-like [Pollicipes pollicipes]|uniref:chromatin target of PRMT1 protein-like n=1 Tax=Pollicipes pollicipes TaxID=41117 RepID=UPI0018852CCB|nr:chromatin target of PRMT1 protein-like [Pollicipes pollicipes]